MHREKGTETIPACTVAHVEWACSLAAGHDGECAPPTSESVSREQAAAVSMREYGS